VNTASIVLGVLLILELVLLASQAGTHRESPTIMYEANIRLPYKKFKEIYPESPMAYSQYKEMQARQAFKSSIPSKKLKRMVR